MAVVCDDNFAFVSGYTGLEIHDHAVGYVVAPDPKTFNSIKRFNQICQKFRIALEGDFCGRLVHT